MELLNINDAMHILNVKTLISTNTDNKIYVNTTMHKFQIKSVEDLDNIIKNLKEREFGNLDIIFSTDININKKEINIWVTPIVKSA